MESVFIATAVIGVVEFIRRLQAKSWLAAVTIALAAIIGAIAGWQQVDGVADVWTGIVLGLSASGIVTTASRISNTYNLSDK
jgi:hypothetical protein